MYISNRKHGFLVVRQFKNGNLLLRDRYGTEFKHAAADMPRYGYRFVRHKPVTFERL